MTPAVQAFFDDETFTVSYLVSDPETGDAVVIDPVLEYNALSSQTSTERADEILAAVRAQGLRVRGILETHAHADHLSGARYLQGVTEAPVAIGRAITLIQDTFRPVFQLPVSTPTDGSQFDQLLTPNEPVAYGSLIVTPLATPGHTPACLSFLIGDAVFTGDALFMEDYGTGRTDFPEGSAETLYQSVHQTLYSLPDSTRVFVGHDYLPGGRALRFESTIGRQKEQNVQLRAETTREEFVTLRNERDKTLQPPRLLYQSIQVNVFGGLLPEEEGAGGRFLKIPLNRRAPTDSRGTPRRSPR